MKGCIQGRYLAALLGLQLLAAPATHANISWQYGYNDQGLVNLIDGPRTDVQDLTHFEYDARGRVTRVTNALGHSSELSDFNAYNQPRRMVDANGIETQLSYDPMGRLTQSITYADGGNFTTTYSYNLVGLLTRVTLPDNTWVGYAYDPARRLSAVTNHLGERLEYTLDSMGNITQQNVLSGSGTLVQTASAVYDKLGRLLEAMGAEGQTSRYQYDVDSNLVGARDARNHPNSRVYDALHRLVSVTDALNQVTQLTYDGQDNVTAVTDPRGVVTQYEYDAFGRMIRLISPDSGTTEYQYDEAGNIVESTDAKGTVTQYHYDALNRLTHKRYPSAPALNIVYEYDASSQSPADYNAGIGRLTSIQDALGRIDMRYDARGQLIERSRRRDTATHQANFSTAYRWDVGSGLSQLTYPSGLQVDYQRSNGQVSGINLSLDTTAQQACEAGLAAQSTPPSSGTSTAASGLMLTVAGGGRLPGTDEFYDEDLALYNAETGTAELFFHGDQVFSGNEMIIAVHHRSNGNLLLVTRDRKRVNGVYFNNDDIIEYNPTTGAASLYFAGSQILSGAVDFSALYVYDDGRLLFSTTRGGSLNGIRYTQGDLVEYNPTTGTAQLHFKASDHLDSRGANINGVHRLSNGNLLLTFANSRNRFGALSADDGDIVEYNLDTREASLYFDGSTFARSEDIVALSVIETGNSETPTSGTLVQADCAPQTLASNIQWQPFGGLKSLTWGNGLTLTRQYDLDGRLAQQQIPGLQTLTYQYDPVSNITGIDDEDRDNQLFQYDPLNRLVNEQQGDTEISYRYDATGNRTERTENSSTAYTTDSHSYAFDSNRRQDDVNYDANGNIIEDASDNQQYRYDAQNRLISYRQGSTQLATYRYNALGERSLKVLSPDSADAEYRYYHYAPGGQLLGETIYSRDSSIPTTAYSYIWLDSLPVAYVAQHYSNDGSLSDQQLVYVHSDHLNTPRLATNADQQPVWQWQSDAFGWGNANEDLDGDGQLTRIQLRFPGQYHDAESGLHYNYFRDYDPSTGRYIQSDPIGLAGGLNTYAYVSGNPLSYIDPLGLQPTGCDDPSDWEFGTAVGCETTIADEIAAEAIMCAIPPARAAKIPKIVDKLSKVTNSAVNNANKVKLNKQLASQEQVGELNSGVAERIAGAGTNKKLRDAPRLANEYGGNNSDWAKIRSSNRSHADGFNQETHAYQNTITGQTVEYKTKIYGH